MIHNDWEFLSRRELSLNHRLFKSWKSRLERYNSFKLYKYKYLCISAIRTSGEWDKFQWYLVKPRLIVGRVVEREPFSSRHSNASSSPLEAITQTVIIVLPLVLLESHFNNLKKCWEVSFCSSWSKKIVGGRPQKEHMDNPRLNSKAVRTELLSASLKDFFEAFSHLQILLTYSEMRIYGKASTPIHWFF